jgi:hypothetical protein
VLCRGVHLLWGDCVDRRCQRDGRGDGGDPCADCNTGSQQPDPAAHDVTVGCFSWRAGHFGYLSIGKMSERACRLSMRIDLLGVVRSDQITSSSGFPLGRARMSAATGSRRRPERITQRQLPGPFLTTFGRFSGDVHGHSDSARARGVSRSMVATFRPRRPMVIGPPMTQIRRHFAGRSEDS